MGGVGSKLTRISGVDDTRTPARLLSLFLLGNVLRVLHGIVFAFNEVSKNLQLCAREEFGVHTVR